MSMAPPAAPAAWQSALDGLPVGVVVLAASEELICLQHNRRFAEVVSDDGAESFVGRRLADVVPASLGTALVGACREALACGRATSVAEFGARAVGEPFHRYYDWTITPFAPDDDLEARLLLAISDTTEQVRARTRVEKFSSLGEQILSGEAPETILGNAVALVAGAVGAEYVGVFQLDADGSQLRAVAGLGLGGRDQIEAGPGSLGAAALADRAALIVPDVIGDSRFPAPPALSARDLRSGIAANIQAPGAPFGLLVAFTRRHRKFAPYEISAVQAVANFYSAALFRKHSEDAIRAQALEIRDTRDLLQAVLQTVTTGVIVRDTDGRAIYCNQSAARALGFRSVERLAEIRLFEMHALLEPADETGRPMTIEQLPGARVFQGDRMPQAVVRIRHPTSGSPRWLIVRARPIADEDGRVRFAVSLFEDITAQRRADEELARRAEQQAAIAELGQRALSGVDIDALTTQATHAVAATLRVDYAGVLELLADRARLLLRSGVGWREGEVQAATVDAARSTEAGYALGRNQPVVLADSGPSPFRLSPLLRRHGVVGGVCTRIGEAERPFGILCAYTATPREFSEDDLHFLQSISNTIGTAVARQAAEDALAEQTRLTDELRFEERLRLAREVHDGLAQELWLAKLKHGRLMEQLDLDGEPQQLSHELGATLQRALDDTRQAVITLRASAGEGPFGEALRRYVEETAARLSLTTHFAAPDRLPDLPPHTAANALRVVQEALNNVARHAKAKEVHVKVAARRDRLTVTVTDDGCGFAIGTVTAGFGLAGMRERARQIGGTLTIRSRPARGTRVRLEIPTVGP